MKKLFISIVIIFANLTFVDAQILIGHNVDEIRSMMKRIRPNFREDNSTVNAKSIKYVDKAKDNTLIFFLSPEGKCLYSKFMLDVSYAKSAVDSLSKKYKYLDNLTWYAEKDDKEFSIKMVNNEYYFTIVISDKED
ncbi:MAG TPA: hypothetical protein DDX39_06325 [Bacteroidales bacterium]|nr:MAG: hypothetical protein A2W98_00500 [Bacteroidetes bacterium GWF2_33_38]OFY72337.1 MAG: hypothetical protein A2265_07370 [Bacteroidetes bacterium RIFOXYA12_FULL_33_9]HBF88241.1 hypothetical protein [Bacteroidales bacterium]